MENNILLKAGRGIEPRIFGLRDRRLTTWPPSHLSLQLYNVNNDACQYLDGHHADKITKVLFNTLDLTTFKKHVRAPEKKPETQV